MMVHFVQHTQAVQCQEEMSTVIHLRIVALERDLKHSVVSEIVF